MNFWRPLAPMASKWTAPKTKRELTEAIALRCAVKSENLMKHTVERLKEIWILVRPQRMKSGLPSGWKKSDKESLEEMYIAHCVDGGEFGGTRPNDRHWRGWRLGQFLMELEMMETDRKEKADAEGGEDDYDDRPMCPQCRLPFVVRTNSYTGVDFLGCIRFPECRQSKNLPEDPDAPIEVPPAAVVKKTTAPKRNPKASVMKGKNDWSAMGKRHQETWGGDGESSDGSWRQVKSPEKMMIVDNEDRRQRQERDDARAWVLALRVGFWKRTQSVWRTLCARQSCGVSSRCGNEILRSC